MEPTTSSRSPSPITTIQVKNKTNIPFNEEGERSGIEKKEKEQDDHNFLTDQLNQLKAELLKAELKGSKDIEAIKAKYDGLLKDRDFKSLEKPNKKNPMYSFLSSGRFVKERQGPKELEKGTKRKSNEKEDSLDLMTLLREEKRIQPGDAERAIAKDIAKDGRFSNSLEYIDETSERISTKLSTSQIMKQAKKCVDFENYQRIKETLEKCPLCFHEDERQSSPLAPILSMGHNAYLALPTVTELVPGHCMIVPGEHCASTLECDDATWNEIRNFMKSLMQMFATINQGVIFFETVPNPRQRKHTWIECIPLPWHHSQDAPAFFKEALLSHGEEWTQNPKLIQTRSKGFRKSMVSELPYFHVWFHPDGGLGHVIESSRGFNFHFGKEVIAGILDLDITKWRKPAFIDTSKKASRLAEFRKKFPWDSYDWTKLLDE